VTKFKQLKNKLKKKFLWRKYHDMAHYFCKGKGLEVGAMCYPYLFNSDCQLKYADIFENNELRRILNEIPLEKLYAEDLVQTDYLLKPPKYLFENIKNDLIKGAEDIAITDTQLCVETELAPLLTLLICFLQL